MTENQIDDLLGKQIDTDNEQCADSITAFANLVMLCAAEPAFVEQFNRLTGCNLGQSANRSPLDMAIDEATGHSGENEDDMKQFVQFVYEVMWLRLPQNILP